LKQTHQIIIDAFLQKYAQVKPLLIANETGLNTESKKIIILANEEFLRSSAHLLNTMTENEKYINSENIQNVGNLSKKVEPIESKHLMQKEETLSVNSRFETLLKPYNEIIMLISEKFAYWDLLLNHCEQQLQIREGKDKT